MPNRITPIDPNLTLLLAQCANEAYYPSRHSPPPGYVYVTQWTGRNPSYFGGDVEPYGMVFRGNTPATASEFIFAFKGTATWWDAWEDIFINKTTFIAYQNSSPSNQVEVADGFFDVYSTDVTSGGNNSMQNQLFNLLNYYKPSKLQITGHSLGSALAELFTLDLHVSLPSLPFTVQHYNFACPRVGGADFAALYNSLESSEPKADETIRVVNYYDEIPCLPFQDLGYLHGPSYFLCSFKKVTDWPHLPHYVVRHSMYNYWQVLKQVMSNPNQTYAGPVTGLNNISLESFAPPANAVECPAIFADELIDIGQRIKQARSMDAC